jgi:hypothetical protein
LFFAVSADQTTLARPPIIEYRYVDGPLGLDPSWAIPVVAGLGLLVVGAFVGIVLYRVASRKQPG